LAWIGAHWKPAQHANIREAQMAKLIYSAISSLDGYVADAEGNFDWSAPDQEVHEFVNDLERPEPTCSAVGCMR
jgi:hypothetical protein